MVVQVSLIKKVTSCWAPVVHTCNPSYSEGRDQEDGDSKPAQANSSQNPVLKKPITNKGVGGVAQGIGPEFQLQHHKERKEGRRERERERKKRK
jgi:hypothetical protein